MTAVGGVPAPGDRVRFAYRQRAGHGTRIGLRAFLLVAGVRPYRSYFKIKLG